MPTIIIDPNNKTKLKVGGRCSIPDKHNSFWNTDYHANTGILLVKEKLSRNHRISDNDIHRIIIEAVNNQQDPATGKRLENLVIHAFPWGNNNTKNDAIVLFNQLMRTPQNAINRKKELAIDLGKMMAQHPNNISKGNASQNSSIGKALDLNAPKNKNGRHSLTPRSRRIVGAEIEHGIGLTPPKKETPSRIKSSQYGKDGPTYKDSVNIDVNNSTPETQRSLIKLMQ